MLPRWVRPPVVAAAAGLLSACGISGTSVPSAVSAGSPPPSGHPVALAVAVASHQPLPPAFYGVNDDYQGAATFARAPRPALLAALAPATLRWPGGTEADFFNWTTGRGTLHPRRFAFTLPVFARDVTATQAMPIVDLRVAPVSDPARLASAIRLLQAARRLGLSVRRVELGNELYSGRFRTWFPSGSAYAATVVRWAQTLHQAFPGIQVAADLCLPTNGRCPAGWDPAVLGLPAGPGAPDAVIVHDYPGAVVRPWTRAALPAFFAGVHQSVTALAAAIRTFGGRPVWLTEYNFRGPYHRGQHLLANPAQTSAARVLYVAAFAIQLPRIPHLALADFWSAFAGGAAYRAWNPGPPPTLTPVGQALAWIDRAARGATSTAALRVRQGPTLPGGAPAVVGQVFWPASGPARAILVNLGAQAVRLAPAGPLAPGTAYHQVATDPLAHPSTAPPATTGRIGSAGLVLPPYSLTAVGLPGSA